MCESKGVMKEGKWEDRNEAMKNGDKKTEINKRNETKKKRNEGHKRGMYRYGGTDEENER